ncbi:MAG: tetratricopeptide repeat protein [Verrucomicrobiae bacterium]|nr:tetratricopeptide repeat protein [Verrucomicrobiae bacterium]
MIFMMMEQHPVLTDDIRRLFRACCRLGWLGGCAMALLLMGAAEVLGEPGGIEQRLFSFGKKALEDRLYELAETQFAALLNQYPGTEFADEAACLLGQSLLKQGRWQEARETLQSRLPKVAPAWVDSYYFWMGEALLKGGFYDEACQTYQQVASSPVKSRYLAEARYGMARAMLQQGKFDEAQVLLKTLQSEGGRDLASRASLSLGVSYFLQKKHNLAVELLNRLAREEHNNVVGFQALYALGEVDMELKKADAARQRFETLAKSDRSEAQGVITEALFRLGQIEMMAGNWAGSAGYFEKAFRKSKDPSFRIRCADELLTVYLKLDKAATLADMLKTWAEDNARTRLGEMLLLQMATLWQRAGKPDQAIQAFQRFFEKYPDGYLSDQARFQLGWVFLEDKKQESAIAEFKIAAERAHTPQLQADAWLKIGDIHFECRQYDAAVAAYAKGAQVKGAAPAKTEQALYQAANASFMGGNLADVFRFQQIHAAEFANGRLAAEFLLLAAEAQRKKNDLEQVTASFKTLLDRYPGSLVAPRAWLGYAGALCSRGKYKESLDAAGQFMKNFPKHELTPKILQVRGRAFELSGQTDKAVAEFEGLAKNYAKTPAAAAAHFWLGAHFQQHKNFARAQEQFELLVKDTPEHPLAPEAGFFAALSAYRLGQNPDDAQRLLERLVKNYPKSPWVFQARFLYADILSEKGKFQDALMIFDDLTKLCDPARTPSMIRQFLEVQGRRGQCLRQIKRYDDALTAFKAVLSGMGKTGAEAGAGDADIRNHTLVEMGKTYENLKDSKHALESYLSPLYERPQSARPDECEFYWISKGALEAVRLLEEQKDWKGAARVLARLAESSLPSAREAVERLKKLKEEHPEAN